MIFVMKTTPVHLPNRSQLRRDSFLIVFGRRPALLLLFLCAALLVQPCAATPFQWEFTGNLHTPRYYHTANLLSDGTVLVIGGATNSPGTFPDPGTPSVELYDPAAGTWTVNGSLIGQRLLHTATLLPNGTLVIAGGWPDPFSTYTWELYDPATGTSPVTGPINAKRAGHTATLLLDGRVLIAGSFHDLDSAELYDQATETWTFTGSLHNGRYANTATLLSNGNVLIAGGWPGDASAELYDPATETWTFTGSLNTGRQGHTATLLANGTVLVAGGMNSGTVTSAEIYDPATGTWTLTGSLNTARWRHAATLLSDGKVLVAGGLAGNQTPLADAEIYDPATGNWTVTGSLNNARCLYTMTLLPDGRVLVAGGKNNDGILATAETFDPGVTPTPTPTPTATPTPTPTATATPTATPASIELTGRGKRIAGTNTSHLKWRGATSANVDVYRDGNVIATTPNDGLYDDSTGTTGQASFMYQVCEAATQTCSNTVTVNFGP
jgi:phage baseplate assembly protein gpV